MFKRFKKQDQGPEPVATNSVGPGDFNLGSLESRAAARAVLEARAADSDLDQGWCVLKDAGTEIAPDVVTKILGELREAGRLPKGRLLDLGGASPVWELLEEAKQERLLREHGTKP